MKKIIFTVLMLIPFLVLAQNTSQLDGTFGWTAERARLLSTHTNFTSSTADTSGFITINVPAIASDPLLCRDVSVIFAYTDSINTALNFNGRNGTLTGLAVNYADTLKDTVTSGTKYYTVILRNATTDRLSGCTQFKVGLVFRNSTFTNGTTAGRILKMYIAYILR